MSATVHRFGDASIYGKANRCVTMSEGGAVVGRWRLSVPDRRVLRSAERSPWPSGCRRRSRRYASRCGAWEAIREELKQQPDRQLSQTDPDSRVRWSRKRRVLASIRPTSGGNFSFRHVECRFRDYVQSEYQFRSNAG